MRYQYNFIIGTPGRLKDLINRKMIHLPEFNTVVLDEADRMLDMGFINDIKKAKNFVLQRLDENQSSHYPSLFTKLHGLIDWSWQGKDIYLFINAFDDPYSGANAYWQGQKIYLSDCQLLPQPEAYHPFTSGLVVRQNKNGIFVATIGNLLQIKKV